MRRADAPCRAGPEGIIAHWPMSACCGAGRQARTPLPGAFPATKAAKARPHAELSQAGTALGQNGMRDAPPGLKVVAMKYASSQIVYAYWDRLRGDRAAPERGEIEPGEIREALADAFVLEMVDGVAMFRLAAHASPRCSAGSSRACRSPRFARTGSRRMSLRGWSRPFFLKPLVPLLAFMRVRRRAKLRISTAVAAIAPPRQDPCPGDGGAFRCGQPRLAWREADHSRAGDLGQDDLAAQPFAGHRCCRRAPRRLRAGAGRARLSLCNHRFPQCSPLRETGRLLDRARIMLRSRQ